LPKIAQSPDIFAIEGRYLLNLPMEKLLDTKRASPERHSHIQYSIPDIDELALAYFSLSNIPIIVNNAKHTLENIAALSYQIQQKDRRKFWREMLKSQVNYSGRPHSFFKDKRAIIAVKCEDNSILSYRNLDNLLIIYGWVLNSNMNGIVSGVFDDVKRKNRKVFIG
jgi:hypothetical protein